MDRLAEVLATAGQRLALDPPAADGLAAGRGTVGGVLATGAAGPLRLRYGSGRDLLIGITIVRADGTIARSGGKVVKNVAGYDLGKLFAGSHGTLGLITQATFRLHPLPAETAYVSAAYPSPPGGVTRTRRGYRVRRSAPLPPRSTGRSRTDPVRACIALEGDPPSVAARAGALIGLLGPDAEATIRAPDRRPGGERARRPSTAGTVLQIGFWPGDLTLVLTELSSTARRPGWTPSVGGSAAAGQLHAALPEDEDPAAVAAFVTALRDALGHQRTERLTNLVARRRPRRAWSCSTRRRGSARTSTCSGPCRRYR